MLRNNDDFKSYFFIAVVAIVIGAVAVGVLVNLDSLKKGFISNSEAAELTLESRFTPSQLQALPKEGWLTNGGNLYNQRYSPLKQINRDTVAQLKGVWNTRLGGSGMGPQFSGEAQPLVYNGVVYIITGANDVFAISVETGEILWKYTAKLDLGVARVLCCGWISRGVGLGDGKIYVGQLDGKLVALDQATGTVVWSVQAESFKDGYSITSAPLYYDGLVITGFAGAEYGTRGRVKAYHANDGSPAWTFYVIPAPGEYGHDTWPQNSDAWKYGGGSVWQTPAVDPELGLIYFSTGNPGPDFDGSLRVGDNLFSVSVVALDVKTGKYHWHFQQVHHDLWDYDAATPVVLFNVTINGKLRKAIVSTNKNGWAYILDRVTGKPLLEITEQPVPQDARQATAATQPIPSGDPILSQEIEIAPLGYKLINKGYIYTPFWKDEDVVIAHGFNGVTNWPPHSYDPRTGILYICGSDNMVLYRTEDMASDKPAPGDAFLGGSFNARPLPATGVFSALDMKTNKLIWQKRWDSSCYSGSLTTAGNLVFTGHNDGRLLALDSTDGHLLWQFQTGAGMNAPVSSFWYKGQQYIVAYAAGNLFADSKRGDHVWLFSLNGSLEGGEQKEDVSLHNAVIAAESNNKEVVGGGKSGNEIFNTACQACHGLSGEGGRNGVSLLNVKDKGLTYIRNTITNGRKQMPSFVDMLSSEEVAAVSEYVSQFGEK